jgi:hypothetical protein
MAWPIPYAAKLREGLYERSKSNSKFVKPYSYCSGCHFPEAKG